MKIWIFHLLWFNLWMYVPLSTLSDSTAKPHKYSFRIVTNKHESIHFCWSDNTKIINWPVSKKHEPRLQFLFLKGLRFLKTTVWWLNQRPRHLDFNIQRKKKHIPKYKFLIDQRYGKWIDSHNVKLKTRKVTCWKRHGFHESWIYSM